MAKAIVKEGAEEKQEGQSSGRKLMGGMKRVMGSANSVANSSGAAGAVSAEVYDIVGRMTENMAMKAGPEVQALWEVRESPELFQAQLGEFETQGSMDFLNEDLQNIQEQLENTSEAETAFATQSTNDYGFAPSTPTYAM